MSIREGFLPTPFLSMDHELESYIGTIDVDDVTIAEQPLDYGLTMASIGINAIRFSTYTTGYDAETTTLTLGVLNQDAPPNVVNPSRQHRSTLAHRSVPASHRPQEYFAERSEELSRTLAGMVLERAVEAGYRSQEMLDLHDGRKLARGGVHIIAAITAAAGLYYATKMGFFDTPVGTAMPIGGLVFVVSMDGLAVGESRRQEAEDLRSLMKNYKLKAETAVPTDLICVTPPGLPQPAHPTTRHPKPRKSHRPVILAGGSRL